jgi:hypothetical protein
VGLHASAKSCLRFCIVSRPLFGESSLRTFKRLFFSGHLANRNTYPFIYASYGQYFLQFITIDLLLTGRAIYLTYLVGHSRYGHFILISGTKLTPSIQARNGSAPSHPRTTGEHTGSSSFTMLLITVHILRPYREKWIAYASYH